MNQNFTCTLSKGFLILVLFSLVSSTILPYYFLGNIGIEHVCENEDKDTTEKEEKKEAEEKKEKIRNNADANEYAFSEKEIKYHNFKNFNFTHFQEIETPPPEFFI